MRSIDKIRSSGGKLASIIGAVGWPPTRRRPMSILFLPHLVELVSYSLSVSSCVAATVL